MALALVSDAWNLFWLVVMAGGVLSPVILHFWLKSR